MIMYSTSISFRRIYNSEKLAPKIVTLFWSTLYTFWPVLNVICITVHRPPDVLRISLPSLYTGSGDVFCCNVWLFVRFIR